MDQEVLLNCSILGPDGESIFPVEILPSKTVGQLKDEIKKKKAPELDHTAADKLHIYKLQIPLPRGEIATILGSIVNGADIPNAVPLDPLEELSFYFPLSPMKGRLHLVVQVPHPVLSPDQSVDVMTGLTERFHGLMASKSLPPSTLAKSNGYRKYQGEPFRIHDNRYKDDGPASTTALPIQLFHPAFAFFSSKAFNPDYKVPHEFLRLTMRLMHQTAGIYKDEHQRGQNLRSLLESILAQRIDHQRNKDGTEPDGVVTHSSGSSKSFLLVMEEKNEFGDADSDPSTQAEFSYLRAHQQQENIHIVERSLCPTFLMAHAGPWLTILGAIITSDCIVQRLTDYLWLPFHSTHDDNQCLRIARVLYVLRESLAQLRTWYDAIPKLPQGLSLARFFPYPSEFKKDGKLFEFKYQKPLETDATCKTYLATLTNDSAQVVVKFVTSYGEEVHMAMADAGFAPNLLYCGPTLTDNLDDYKMVVMEYVSARDKDPTRLLDAEELGQLGEIIKTLHTKGYVFGDLRRPNILVTKEKKVQLIDFDWAGKEGDVRYPMCLSPYISWAPSVHEDELIRKEHDLFMLNKLLNP